MRARVEANHVFNRIVAEITEIPEDHLFTTVDIWAGQEQESRHQLRVARRVAGIVRSEFQLEASPVLMPGNSSDVKTFICISRLQ